MALVIRDSTQQIFELQNEIEYLRDKLIDLKWKQEGESGFDDEFLFTVLSETINSKNIVVDHWNMSWMKVFEYLVSFGFAFQESVSGEEYNKSYIYHFTESGKMEAEKFIEEYKSLYDSYA